MLPSNSVGFNEDMNESGIIARTFPASGRSLSEWTQTRAGLASLQTGTQPACVCARCKQRHVTVGTHAFYCASRDVRPCGFFFCLFFFSRQCANFVHNSQCVFTQLFYPRCGNSPTARCAACVFLTVNSTTPESKPTVSAKGVGSSFSGVRAHRGGQDAPYPRQTHRMR